MNIQTKFSNGHKVYALLVSRLYQRMVQCTTCTGSGRIKFENLDRTGECPDCRGRGEKYEPYDHHDYTILGPRTIGKVEAEIYGETPGVGESYRGMRRVRYMCEESGVGSGACYGEEDLFLNREEAEAKGEKRMAEYDKRMHKRKASEE